MADERHDRNCPKRSLSPRNCAQPDSRRRGGADAIAGKHSARASREIPRTRKLQQTRVHDFLNAPTCSLRRDLLTALRLAQEISAPASLGSARVSHVGEPVLSAAEGASRQNNLSSCDRHDPRITLMNANKKQSVSELYPCDSRYSRTKFLFCVIRVIRGQLGGTDAVCTKLIVPRLATAYSGLLIAFVNADGFSADTDIRSNQENAAIFEIDCAIQPNL
jgi:hypothetical protein